MTFVLTAVLILAALYCFGMYGYLTSRTFRYGENWEVETFHLGLCLVLAVGFLLLADAQIGAVDRFLHSIQTSAT